MKRLPAFLQKRFAAVLAVLFSLTLVPMLAVSAYNFPMGDDYKYSMGVHQALLSGGSVWAVLLAAARTVALTYKSWQGTYSAVFVMALQPGVFADRAYALVPFIMLGFLIFATLKLLHTILCVCMSEKIRMVLLLGVPMLFLSIQHLPSANQGFYWFNGASYYTLFYSVMLLYVDSVILFIKSTGKGRAAARFIIAVLLAAILGGANFVTALLTFIAGFIFIVYSHSKKRGRLPQAIVLQVIFLIGFSVSVLAPGNAVRQAKFSGMGVPLTLLFSLGQSGGDIFLWSLEAVPVFILLIPLLYRLAGRSTFGFRLPGVFLLLTLLLFASQNAPPYYAMGWGGEDRLRDIVYYSFTWLMPANIFYFLGWACKRRPERAEKWRVFKRRLGLRDGSRAVACCAVALFLIAALNPLALHYTSSWVSARSLLDGGARSYGQQMNARLAVYEDKSVLRVQLPVLTVKPEPVFYADITDNPETMNNLDIRDYYQKSSVAAGDGK